MDSVKRPDWLYPLEPLDPNGPGCLGYPSPRDEPPGELVDYDELIESEFDQVQKAARQAAIEEIDLLKDRLADLLSERDELRGQVESLITENDRLRVLKGACIHGDVNLSLIQLAHMVVEGTKSSFLGKEIAVEYPEDQGREVRD